MAPMQPSVFASPIHAGCKTFTASRCQIWADPFTISVSAGKRLTALRIALNGVIAYDYMTDVSNPPVGNYSPSPVKMGFAARCGATYTVSLQGRDSGDATFFVLGSTTVACPAPTYLIGDVNGDGVVNVSDVFYLINFLFAGGPAPIGDGDVNGSGDVTVADVFYLVNDLFAGGPAPV